MLQANPFYQMLTEVQSRDTSSGIGGGNDNYGVREMSVLQYHYSPLIKVSSPAIQPRASEEEAMVEETIATVYEGYLYYKSLNLLITVFSPVTPALVLAAETMVAEMTTLV